MPDPARKSQTHWQEAALQNYGSPLLYWILGIFESSTKGCPRHDFGLLGVDQQYSPVKSTHAEHPISVPDYAQQLSPSINVGLVGGLEVFRRLVDRLIVRR